MNHFHLEQMAAHNRRRIEEEIKQTRLEKLARKARQPRVEQLHPNIFRVDTMSIKILAILLLSAVLLSACSFIVTLPDATPVVISQPTETEQTSLPTSMPTLVPSAVPMNTLVPTLVPSLVPTLIPTLTSKNQDSYSCAATWFFIFNARHRSLGSYCPEPVKVLSAVGQDFEGGRVYRYAPDPTYPSDQRGTIYVIYNDGEWVTFPDTWDSSQPSFDPDMLVPADRYQPVDGIGKIWRDIPEVRQRLGWAYAPQAAFQGRFQAYSLTSNPPPDGSGTHYYFIDHGEWRLVLLLDAVDMGPNKWEVAGADQ